MKKIVFLEKKIRTLENIEVISFQRWWYYIRQMEYKIWPESQGKRKINSPARFKDKPTEEIKLSQIKRNIINFNSKSK